MTCVRGLFRPSLRSSKGVSKCTASFHRQFDGDDALGRRDVAVVARWVFERVNRWAEHAETEAKQQGIVGGIKQNRADYAGLCVAILKDFVSERRKALSRYGAISAAFDLDEWDLPPKLESTTERGWKQHDYCVDAQGELYFDAGNKVYEAVYKENIEPYLRIQDQNRGFGQEFVDDCVEMLLATTCFACEERLPSTDPEGVPVTPLAKRFLVWLRKKLEYVMDEVYKRPVMHSYSFMDHMNRAGQEQFLLGRPAFRLALPRICFVRLFLSLEKALGKV